ncbi:hypothetical protein J6590_069925 [Homalodisca vitripennis]|nr:hypothetical protein J6590_069925 [Homalodisca vitripennis]
MAPPARQAYPPNMTESVSFKAYLKRDGQDVEVRRFGIDGGLWVEWLVLRPPQGGKKVD